MTFYNIIKLHVFSVEDVKAEDNVTEKKKSGKRSWNMTEYFGEKS